MRNLMTRKLALGLLMACVLAFGVQSVADALTFGTSRRGDLATVGIGDEFTITFSVTLGSNTTPIRNANGDLVAEDDTTRIDTSGYNVFEAPNGREYRISTAANGLPGTQVVGARPSYIDQTPQATTVSGTLYVSGGSATSEGSVVNDAGETVYIQSGTGARDNPDTPTNENDPFVYTAARAMPNDPQTNAARYHYNDERIAIAVTGANIEKVGSTSITPATNLTLTETVDGATDARANTDPGTRLTGSVTLTLRAAAAAAVAIAITDTTPADDLGPAGTAPQQDFTVYVVGPLNPAGNTVVLTGTTGVYRVSDQSDTPINGHFTFDPTANEPVYYTVEGSGRVYVSIPTDRDRKTNPTNNLYTSSLAPVFLDANGGSSKVTAYIAGSSSPATVLYIFSGAQLSELPQIEIISGDTQTGAPSGRLDDYFEVKVTDGKSRPISGLPVTFANATGSSAGTFIPVPGTSLYADAPDEGSIDARKPTITVATTTTPAAAATHYVQTDSSGVAKIYYQLSSTQGPHTVTATAHGIGISTTLTATASSSARARLANLEIVSGNNQRGEKGKYLKDDLVVIVRSLAGHRVQDAIIQFRTTTGTLVPAEGTTQPATVLAQTLGTPLHPTSGQQIYVETGPDGEAGVSYNVGQVVEARDVIAEVREEAQTDTQYDFAIDRVVFNINGGGTSTTPQTTIPNTTITVGDTTDDEPVPDEIEIISGNDGQTGTPGSALSNPFIVRVVDSADDPIEGIRVYFDVDEGGGSLDTRSVRTDAAGEAETTLTLGSSPGENTVIATLDDDDLDVDDVTFTATAIAQPESIAIVSGNDQDGTPNRALAEAFVVKVTDVNGNPVEGANVLFRVRSGPGRFPGGTRITDTTNSRGEAESQRLFLTETAFGTVRVTAEVGGAGSVDFTVNAGEPPDALLSVSGNNQNGAPGSKLNAPFVVEVLDADDNPMPNVTVTFRVTAGGGKVSPTSVSTNSSGRAQTVLTLGEERGDNTVVASVSGLSRTVTFRARASAVVLVDAANRPPLYWVDRAAGTLHRLVDEETEDLAPNMKGATSLTVDAANGYIYWIAQTGQNKGAIRRSSLNGRGAQTLKVVSSLPMGIAVDGAGGTVYWTNARGNILSMPVGGGKVTNIAKNLSSPGPLALSNGVLYWGEATGSVRKMSLTAKPKTIENLATGLGTPLAITIAKGKVYWIERGGGNGGKLQRANLNGNGIQQLKGFPGGVPIGFAIDSSENRIYWTKSAGKIQRGNLMGRFVKDVVTGLMSPGAIALGTAVADDTPVVQDNQQRSNNQQTNNQQTTYSIYDINRDGAVNNRDTRLVAAAVGQSGNAITNPRTDVDGSGTVDVTDLILVLGNLDDDVAAPELDVDVKALDVDFDRVQEQVEVLLASGDRSIAAQRALLYLQHLLASARPDETLLLANYPNPFNPETWIPYHLAESTDVRVNIYDAQGTLVRVLTVGHQSAGYYTSRSRAAYWDGRNALGERVASGIYFYQLQTDEISPLRKMVILK